MNIADEPVINYVAKKKIDEIICCHRTGKISARDAGLFLLDVEVSLQMQRLHYISYPDTIRFILEAGVV